MKEETFDKARNIFYLVQELENTSAAVEAGESINFIGPRIRNMIVEDIKKRIDGLKQEFENLVDEY